MGAASGGRSGRLLIIGGHEDRKCGKGALESLVQLSGGSQAKIAVVTTATEIPDDVTEEYTEVFNRLGVSSVRELRVLGRAAADEPALLAHLEQATGVLFSGGDQSRIRTLVGSKMNALLRRRLYEDGLIIAGTSAGATAMGRWMILGGEGHDVAASTVRIGPGLGLIENVLIDMHFNERGRLPRLLSGVALDTRNLGLGIDEDTAVLVHGHKFKVIGTGVVTVVDADQATVAFAAEDDDPLALFDVHLHLLPDGYWFDIEKQTPSIEPLAEEE